ncbi:mannosyltransferase OCH1 and related enzymes [Candidatus Scalindua japonica]|uniref:Mannosyltransferase OCH1 and related enzymes n=1 Tax=Candidatus Scalindua japonica TaxID=1284222 RepID=A0A286U2Z6_9BACT|nr:glycosyltransferase [Candidatus Scalindua japonica]GAX62520.1 mannosyltransferase OCH1 and related enzymes [Candidatus Scalindua japonica]
MIDISNFNKSIHELYVDFDLSLGKGSKYFKQIEKYVGRNKKIYEVLKDLYKQNNLLNVQPGNVPRIPKIIHHIWIGDRPLPQTYKNYMKSWRKYHPDWEFKIWRNKEVLEHSFTDKKLKSLFSQKLTIGEMVDILKYDILFTYGGLYVDCDCLCLKPHDILHYCYDFYAGIFPPLFASIDNAINVSNGLIGCVPGHHIFPALSDLLVSNWNNLDYRDDEVYTTLQRTFGWLTDALVETAYERKYINIAMPTGYFFPVTAYPVFDFLIRGPLTVLIDFFLKREGPFSHTKPYSFSNHCSGKEWMYDLYSTVSLRHLVWTAFTLKDWKLFIKSKLFKKNLNKTRRSFYEMITPK